MAESNCAEKYYCMWSPAQIELRGMELDLSISGQGLRAVQQLVCDGIVVGNAIDVTEWSCDSVKMWLCEACLVESCSAGGWVSIRRFGDRIFMLPEFGRMLAGEWEETEYEPPRWMAKMGALSLPLASWTVFESTGIRLPDVESIPMASTAELLRLFHFQAPRAFLPDFLSPGKANWDLILGTSGQDGDRDARLLKQLFSEPATFKDHETVTPLADACTVSVFLDLPTILEWPVFSSEPEPAVRLSEGVYFRPKPMLKALS